MRTLQSRDSEIAPTEDRISIALLIQSVDRTLQVRWDAISAIETALEVFLNLRF